jgi:hypothetical protein
MAVIRITIGNKHVAVLILFVSIMATFGIAGAYNNPAYPSSPPANPAAMGHSVDEIDWNHQIPAASFNSLSASSVSAGSVCVGSNCKNNWPRLVQNEVQYVCTAAGNNPSVDTGNSICRAWSSTAICMSALVEHWVSAGWPVVTCGSTLKGNCDNTLGGHHIIVECVDLVY